MRQIWITKAGPPEVLQVREAPDPEPKSGEVRIRVEASGINFADILGRLGIYPDLPPIPVAPGYEVGGRIDALGAGVDARWAGRDVFAMTRFGGYADVICVPVAQVFERPDGMSAGEGAAIPVNYFTAWQLCVVMGRAQARRNSARSFGRRRRRDRRNADRQAYRCDRDRNRVGGKARRNARLRRRSSDRLPDRGF